MLSELVEDKWAPGVSDSQYGVASRGAIDSLPVSGWFYMGTNRCNSKSNGGAGLVAML